METPVQTVSSETIATLQIQSQPDLAHWAEQFKHKNLLQEYTQRSALPLPNYHTVNEGSPHAPQFRSIVEVDGTSYKSAHTFVHRKEAEQYVAKFALESILKKIRDEGCPLIHEDTTFCKSILNEFAVKVNVVMPTYTTVPTEGGPLPLFVSTLVFDGKTYKGDPGRSKKEAEQLGARAVIQSIMGTDFGPLLSQIIKSKTKLISALHKVYDKNTSQSVPYSEVIIETENFPQPPLPENVPQSTLPLLKLDKPKLKLECGTSAGLVANVVQAQDQSPCGASETANIESEAANIIGRKRLRKKNKNKGLKKICADGRSEADVHPLIQASS